MVRNKKGKGRYAICYLVNLLFSPIPKASDIFRSYNQSTIFQAFLMQSSITTPTQLNRELEILIEYDAESDSVVY